MHSFITFITLIASTLYLVSTVCALPTSHPPAARSQSAPVKPSSLLGRPYIVHDSDDYDSARLIAAVLPQTNSLIASPFSDDWESDFHEDGPLGRVDRFRVALQRLSGISGRSVPASNAGVDLLSHQGPALSEPSVSSTTEQAAATTTQVPLAAPSASVTPVPDAAVAVPKKSAAKKGAHAAGAKKLKAKAKKYT